MDVVSPDAPMQIIESITQFGVAGLMGALWIWERRMSRAREQQLAEAHDRIMQDHEHLRVLIRLVRRNTKAIERFEHTQNQLCQILETARPSAVPPVAPPAAPPVVTQTALHKQDQAA